MEPGDRPLDLDVPVVPGTRGHRRWDHAVRDGFTREEVSTVGFDDFLQLVGGDPEGSPYATGVRIPDLPGVRYVVLGAACDLNKGDEVVGFRTLVEIAARLGSGTPPPGIAAPTALAAAAVAAPVLTPPIFPDIIDVRTPGWHFIDGFTSFHFTVQPKPQTRTTVGPFDQPSFIFEDSDQPAMLYETAAGAGGPGGYLALTGYTPPGLLGTPHLVWRDHRFPWRENEHASIRYRASRVERVRLYVVVRQTDPLNRNEPALPSTPEAWAEADAREDRFLQKFPRQVRYHRVAVSMIVDRYQT